MIAAFAHPCLPVGGNRSRIADDHMRAGVMRYNLGRLVSVVGAAAAVGLGASSACAQPVAEFYKGKTITLLLSSAAGGGYDTLARTIANHLGKHVPGAPAVIVKNMAGAGGIVATNHL